MAKSFDFLGPHKQHFMKQSLDVYTDLSGTLQYVGKTQNEKTFSPGIENVEWLDNSGNTQVPYAIDIDKVDPSMTFSFMQVTDPNVLQLALNADFDTTDSSLEWGFLGSNPDEYSEAEWRFVAQSVGGYSLTIVFRRAIAFSNGEISLGSPGSYSEVPITVRALQDTSVTNTKRDLVYWFIDKRTFS